MDATCDSEKKRLQSLKHKKEIFRAKELAVQNALKNLDGKLNSNKIIFDNDFGNEEEPKRKVKQKEKKRKRDLFDDDNNSDGKNDDELFWDDSKFERKKDATGKFLGGNITLGNDERFKLDERFMDDDGKLEKNICTGEDNGESNLQKEKELQLDILESILGVPIAPKIKDTNKDQKVTKKSMVRYDPTENDHKEYEINVEKSETDSKKIKKKRKTKDSAEDTTDIAPLEVSKDVYFSVSDTLSKSLKEGGQFSLLKTYAKAESNEKGDNDNVVPNTVPLQPQKFQFNFTSKNPFKYDSSDDERDDKEANTITETCTNYVVEHTNKFFFDVNDVRFTEAQNFFCKESAPEDTFSEVRRELKQIVRSKIRRNVKKKQPWGYKKKVKRSF